MARRSTATSGEAVWRIRTQGRDHARSTAVRVRRLRAGGSSRWPTHQGLGRRLGIGADLRESDGGRVEASTPAGGEVANSWFGSPPWTRRECATSCEGRLNDGKGHRATAVLSQTHDDQQRAGLVSDPFCPQLHDSPFDYSKCFHADSARTSASTHPPNQKRGSRRALGHDSGRSLPPAVQERPANVRRHLSEVIADVRFDVLVRLRLPWFTNKEHHDGIDRRMGRHGGQAETGSAANRPRPARGRRGRSARSSIAACVTPTFRCSTTNGAFRNYPAVLGHEVIGRVVAVGPAAKGLTVGQRVGIGWTAGSCMHCRQCMSGDQHLCLQAQPTIVGHRGGFASRVRSHWAWALPLPERLNFAEAGPLLVRRHHRLQSAGDVRQADQPRRHRGHRRPGPHGRQVRRRLWLRRDGLHLQRKQVRRGPRLRRQPRRLEPRFGRDQEAGRHVRSADRDGERHARLGGADRLARPERPDARRRRGARSRSRSRPFR